MFEKLNLQTTRQSCNSDWGLLIHPPVLPFQLKIADTSASPAILTKDCWYTRQSCHSNCGLLIHGQSCHSDWGLLIQQILVTDLSRQITLHNWSITVITQVYHGAAVIMNEFETYPIFPVSWYGASGSSSSSPHPPPSEKNTTRPYCSMKTYTPPCDTFHLLWHIQSGSGFRDQSWELGFRRAGFWPFNYQIKW